MILDKMRSCMWKLVIGFRSYGMVRLLGTRPQSQRIFWDFMILMDSFYDSGKNEVLFVKNWSYGSGLTAWYIHVLTKAFGPNCSKLIWRPHPDPKSHSSEIQKFFHAKLHKILHETGTYFQILHHFWQSYECFFPENGKKAHQNSSFRCHSRYVSFPKVLPENTTFFGMLGQI